MQYKLVYYGNKTLRDKAEDVLDINDEIIELIKILQNTMYMERGIGLAAPQIDISKKIIVCDVEMYDGPLLSLINPEIISSSEDKEPFEEGCLSFPGISSDIYRPSKVLVKGITPDSKEMKIEAEGILARVLQHEIDHLNGVLFIDHLEEYRRKELTSRLKKIKKLNSKS